MLGAIDRHLFHEGRHLELHDVFGARGTARGVHFAVWAPNATRVAVIGDRNDWDPDRDPMQPIEYTGVWQVELEGWRPGDRYKYRIDGPHGFTADKADPCAAACECPPATASIVADLTYTWHDDDWVARRPQRQANDRQCSIYEVHLGSWRRDADGGWLRYGELADALAAHVHDLGFTHVELLPVMEHPFSGSWGYQTTGYFAPTARFGTPQEFMGFVDTLHAHDIGVIVDWVPSHFPNDPHGLARFDGTHLYEHADDRQGFHPDWKSCIFNYGRHEVRSFLLSSARCWIERYHVDGIRVDAVASMLYLDYSRGPGEWIPNAYGGRENLEAIAFLRELNDAIELPATGVRTFAEESTAWPGVTAPVAEDGLGFGFKWDMGWMHDTLRHVAREPVHRRFHLEDLTFRSVYAQSERFVLPLSHDEVVYEKRALAAKAPGDEWQQLATLRLLLATQWATPGKQLVFMGTELASSREWDHDGQLPWDTLDEPGPAGMQQLLRDLNRIQREEPALHAGDFEAAGFEWLGADADTGVVAWLRTAPGRDARPVVCVVNWTPAVRHDHRVGVPVAGDWCELLNTDAGAYGGSGVGNAGRVRNVPAPLGRFRDSLTLVVPPLAALWLAPGS